MLVRRSDGSLGQSDELLLDKSAETSSGHVLRLMRLMVLLVRLELTALQVLLQEVQVLRCEL